MFYGTSERDVMRQSKKRLLLLGKFFFFFDYRNVTILFCLQSFNIIEFANKLYLMIFVLIV